jgi:hypothetical protein
LERFEADLNLLFERLSEGLDEGAKGKLMVLRNKLIRLHMRNVVKINHSVMELICAKHLILSGYDVDVERLLDGISCDVYASKGLGTLIVEVETGYIPPEHALDPLTYCRARIASKITRYSGFATKFGLATPPHYVMQIPRALIKPPRYRSSEEIWEIKELCDLYYKSPPVSVDEIRNARLHMVLIVDVDRARIQEIDPEDYVEMGRQWAY